MTSSAAVPAYLATIVDGARERPDAVAVADLGGSMTRADLAARAGGVAARLGGTAGRVAAVIAGDVHELAAAGVGALAAGWTVVPMDWRQGSERLTGSLTAVGADVILVGRHAGRVGPDARSDRTVVELGGLPDADLVARPVHPDRAAVLISSSGSTGRPKVMPRSHRALQQGMEAPSRVALGAGDRFGTLLGATGSILNRLLATLVQGASFHCLDARSAEPTELVAGFRSQGVTVLNLVPTYLRRLLEAVPEGVALPTLRLLTTIGEPLRWDDVARIRARLNPDAPVINRYGSTDAASIAMRVIPPDEPVGTGTVPVGHPHPGITVHLVGDDGQPTPDGEPGEVVVDSPLLRDVPGRTDLPDGRARYRTGDLGRLRPDGQLELLGRIDRLVKIGGIRVEPARVEHLLRTLPWVTDAFVLPEPGPDDVPVLVAHLVGTPGPDDLGPHLDHHLRTALHPAEVPHRLVIRTTPFPTLPSGKIDGRHLSTEPPTSPGLTTHHLGTRPGGPVG